LNFNKICVIGLGYIGLPTASTFATHGIKVVGVDVNQRVVKTLQNGEIHIHEPGLRTLVQAAIKSGNLQIHETPQAADAFIIAVPTPFKAQSSIIDRQSPTYPLADLSYVTAAAETITPHLQAGNLVEGPAIVEHPMTTLPIPPGRRVNIDENLIFWYK